MFFYLSKPLFSGFLPFEGDFARGQKKQDTVNEILYGQYRVMQEGTWKFIVESEGNFHVA